MQNSPRRCLTVPKSALGKGLDSLLPPDITDLYSNDAAAQSSDVQSSTGQSGAGQSNDGQPFERYSNNKQTNNGQTGVVQLSDTQDHTAVSAPVELDPALLKPNPFQPRRTFNE